MDLFLGKLLPLFVLPLGLAFVLFALAVLLRLFGRRRLALAAVLVAVAQLWLAATPAFANWLYARLEVEPLSVADLPEADAIIVLGGVLSGALPPRQTPDASGAVDRVLHAAALFRAGRAPVVIVAAGNLPWQEGETPEADLIRDLLVELGVPAEAVVLDRDSRNTRENALKTAALMAASGWASALLVTSSAHMPRAEATFVAAGVAVTPAATDVEVAGPLAATALDFVPTADGLARTTAALREWLGLAIYRLRGWA